MESGGDKVLAPVDGAIDCKTHQLSRGVLLGEVLEALEGAKQKVIVLDACRDNPVREVCPPLPVPPTLSFHNFKIPDAGNFLLFSSTKPGQVALDGELGKHSPFARALFAALDAMPAVHFDQVFNRTAKAVIETTTKESFLGKPQVPEMLVRGGSPEACLTGKACADPRPLNCAKRWTTSAPARPRPELSETARVTLEQIETSRASCQSRSGGAFWRVEGRWPGAGGANDDSASGRLTVLGKVTGRAKRLFSGIERP
jgi:hypothetical protein